MCYKYELENALGLKLISLMTTEQLFLISHTTSSMTFPVSLPLKGHVYSRTLTSDLHRMLRYSYSSVKRENKEFTVH